MDKKKSETLRQREKAQKDLLELKKMRAGLLDTEHLDDSDKKIIYEITDIGREVLKAEIARIKLVYGNILSQEASLK